MQSMRTIPLAAALAAALFTVAGCDKREAAPAGTPMDPGAGTAASAPGTGSTGTMGDTPAATPPMTAPSASAPAGGASN